MCAMVAVVVLAAGASSRFGSPKQQVLLAPVLERVRRAPSVGEVVVVVGEDVGEEDVGDLPPSSSVTGMRFCAAYCMMRRLVVVSPVNAILAMRFEEARGLPASRPKPFTVTSRRHVTCRRTDPSYVY